MKILVISDSHGDKYSLENYSKRKQHRYDNSSW